MKEECGIDINVLYPFAVISGMSSSHPGRHILRMAYLCKQKSNHQNVVLSSDHQAYQWISLPNLKELQLSDILQSIIADSGKLQWLQENT